MKRKRSPKETPGTHAKPFPRAAKPPTNPMKDPRALRRKADRTGVTRWFSFRELAAFVAISNGVNHVYAISKIFETSQPTILRACQALVEGELISKTRTKRKNRTIVSYELNEDGRELLEIVKKYDEFIAFDKWVKYQKESGFQSIEGIQK